jgi:hypothetical protein
MVYSTSDSAELQHHIINMAPKRSGKIVRLEPEDAEILESYP